MNVRQVEEALDGGRLWVLSNTGRYWLARRNGATRTWKTRPGHFSIPVKAGLNLFGRVEHDSTFGLTCVISDHEPRRKS